MEEASFRKHHFTPQRGTLRELHFFRKSLMFCQVQFALCCLFERKGSSFQWHLHLLRIICLVVAVVSSTPRITYSNVRMTQAQALEERYACGARAAFVLIRMTGRDVTYSTVRDHAAPSEEGSSLEEVRDGLLAHDVQCAVRRLQLTDLPLAHYPFILHVNHRGGLDVGHFFLVTGVDKVGLHTYDPVTGLKRHWPWRSFVDVWSGYAIVPTRVTIRNEQSLLSYLLGVHILVAAFVVVSLRQKKA